MKWLIIGSVLILIGRTGNQLYFHYHQTQYWFLKDFIPVWPDGWRASLGDSAQLLGLGFALYWSAWFLFLRHRACPTARATAKR